jgi:hypothetical protein
MIESFKVIANPLKNNLLMQLRGYFMKSELELAFYLAKKESKLLAQGFDVFLDFDGMYTNKELDRSIYNRAQETFNSLGAGRIKSIGVINKAPKLKKHDLEHFLFDSVGFYPN